MAHRRQASRIGNLGGEGPGAEGRGAFLPITLRLTPGSRALVVGGGAVAAARAEWLLAGGVPVDVIAEALGERLDALVGEGRVVRLGSAWETPDLRQWALVLAATDDPALNRTVHAAALAAGIPVNVADAPSLSSFLVPAQVSRGPLRVAITTEGLSPSLAVRLRQELDSLLPPWLGDWAGWLGRARERILRAIPDRVRRRHVLASLAGRQVQDLLADSRDREAAFEALVGAALSGAADPPSPGKVWLVGVGPGDPGLITVRGLECLRRADAVLHDGLVNRELLLFARRDATIVDTSKRAGCPRMDQDAIHALMLRLVREGAHVCRLKGGDPCLFARGGEEAAFLASHGVPWEIVSGVPSALAVPAAAGIPLTHRDHASYVQIVTGHEDPSRGQSRLDFAAMSRGGGTLVFLMGSGRLREICGRLLDHGMAPDTPVAVLSRGTLPDQEIVQLTLTEAASGSHVLPALPRPSLFVVGDVVSLRVILA